jgi:3-hydroxyisobutyrate dehydrogenase-like beta-hydroxyacid dehydrogenase
MNTTPKTVSVIGLDDVCINLACLLEKKSQQVTVFCPPRSNTSTPFINHVSHLESAIESSSTIITCFHDRSIIDTKLCSPDATYSLYDKGLLNLIISGVQTASASRAMATWAQREGIHYVEAQVEVNNKNAIDNYKITSTAKSETGRYLVNLLEQIVKDASTS